MQNNKLNKRTKRIILSNCVSDEPKISYIPTFKVKEFIRLLKEEICWCSNPSLKEGELCSDCKNINKLAGDKLI